MKILIAEDDAVSRILLSRTLQALGYECLVGSDGEEAWRLWLDNPVVDVIVSDWLMPQVEGPELCRRIRSAADPRRAYPYFIFLTTLSDREHLLAGLAAGADDYLTKPLDREQLQARLKVAERVTGMQRQLAAQRDELERLNAELAALAREDALTGAGNRLRLAEDLAALRDRAERYGHRYCLLICDLDSFKAYNDRYGHLAGDDALRRVADLFRRELRPTDTLYRFGGEEFIVVLPEQDPGGARVVAERLRQGIEDLAMSGGEADRSTRKTLTASFGLAAVAPWEKKSAEDLIGEADCALYRAKASGKNRIELYGQDGQSGESIQ